MSSNRNKKFARNFYVRQNLNFFCRVKWCQADLFVMLLMSNLLEFYYATFYTAESVEQITFEQIIVGSAFCKTSRILTA